jgi:hypothetical protein
VTSSGGADLALAMEVPVEKTQNAYRTILAGWVWARRDYRRVGMQRVGEIHNSFWAETLSKM